MQSSPAPDPGHHMENEKLKHTEKHHTQESQVVSPFPAGDHKAARNRQYSITKTNMDHKKEALPWKG